MSVAPGGGQNRERSSSHPNARPGLAAWVAVAARQAPGETASAAPPG